MVKPTVGIGVSGIEVAGVVVVEVVEVLMVVVVGMVVGIGTGTVEATKSSVSSTTDRREKQYS